MIFINTLSYKYTQHHNEILRTIAINISLYDMSPNTFYLQKSNGCRFG